MKIEGAVRRRGSALTFAGILAGWFSRMSLFRCRIHMRLSCCDFACGQNVKHHREDQFRPSGEGWEEALQVLDRVPVTSQIAHNS